ncbi:MAG: sensor histidine kinase, partial [Armatimonadetes bacterium]|nr:sensor histidine kinase [Armatimonadota bacterium]
PEWIAAAARELARTDLNESRREDLNAYVQLAGTRLLDVMSGVEDAVSEVDQHLARIERMLPLPDALEAEPLIEPFGFAEVVPEALGSLRPELRSLLQLDLAPDLSTVAPVLGVKTTTEQILANVLANAVEARGQDNGSVARVRLTARLTEDSGRRMVDLLVADNGLGIAPRDIDRVFENGFSTKPDHSGLGLHWCANAAHAMGGRMYAENPESGGATFHVLLPAADEAQREQPQC